VATDAQPDNVWIAGLNRRTVAEERAAIVGPGELPDSFAALISLDAQSFSDDSVPEIFDEFCDCQLELRSLLVG
jgi:hypothetical protein